MATVELKKQVEEILDTFVLTNKLEEKWIDVTPYTRYSDLFWSVSTVNVPHNEYFSLYISGHENGVTIKLKESGAFYDFDAYQCEDLFSYRIDVTKDGTMIFIKIEELMECLLDISNLSTKRMRKE